MLLIYFNCPFHKYRISRRISRVSGHQNRGQKIDLDLYEGQDMTKSHTFSAKNQGSTYTPIRLIRREIRYMYMYYKLTAPICFEQNNIFKWFWSTDRPGCEIRDILFCSRSIWVNLTGQGQFLTNPKRNCLVRFA